MWCPFRNAQRDVGCWPLAWLPCTLVSSTYRSESVTSVQQHEWNPIFQDIQKQAYVQAVSWRTSSLEPQKSLNHHMWCSYHNAQYPIRCWTVACLPYTFWLFNWSAPRGISVQHHERSHISKDTLTQACQQASLRSTSCLAPWKSCEVTHVMSLSKCTTWCWVLTAWRIALHMRLIDLQIWKCNGFSTTRMGSYFAGYLVESIWTSDFMAYVLFCTTKKMWTSTCDVPITLHNMVLGVDRLHVCLTRFGHKREVLHESWVFNNVILAKDTLAKACQQAILWSIRCLHHTNDVSHHRWCPSHNAPHVVGFWPLGGIPCTSVSQTSESATGVQHHERNYISQNI